MDGRFTVLPEEQLEVLRPILELRMREAAGWAGAERFAEFFDASMRTFLVDGFHRVGAHEGTIWMLDAERQHLIPRFNSGPHAAAFVGSFRQTLRTGMISMVAATQQPICENDMCRDARQDTALDRQLQLQTCAMLAVPFSFMGEVRGVISCVQLKAAGSAEPDPPGFPPKALQTFQLTAGVLARLIEYRLLALCLGLENLG